MEISAKELRRGAVKIIEQAVRGTEIIITVRGRKKARLVAYREGKESFLILDTDVLIWYLRGNEKAKELIHRCIPFSISKVFPRER